MEMEEGEKEEAGRTSKRSSWKAQGGKGDEQFQELEGEKCIAYKSAEDSSGPCDSQDQVETSTQPDALDSFDAMPTTGQTTAADDSAKPQLRRSKRDRIAVISFVDIDDDEEDQHENDSNWDESSDKETADEDSENDDAQSDEIEEQEASDSLLSRIDEGDEDLSDDGEGTESPAPLHLLSKIGKPTRISTTGKRKQLKTRKALILHSRKHYSSELLKCGFCSAQFNTMKKRNAHLQTHKNGAGKYKCDQCEYSCKRADNVRRHLRIHSGEKPFQCDQCKKSFAGSNELKVHKRIHSGEKPFLCDQCPESFRILSNLQAHKRLHSGERPYSCDQCDKSFRLSGDLKSHKRIHSGEKPFQCDQCGKTFTQLHHLTTHSRTHSGEKPYQCGQCLKRFTRKENLASHQKTVHSKPPVHQ